MITISVVIPSAGRVALLKRCLEAIAHQSIPSHSYEVIVVDDAPPLGKEAIRCFSRLSSFNCRYVQTHGHEGPAAARNRGWRAARGKIIAFTDDDTVPDPQWLSAGLAAFQPGVLAVSGKTVVPLPEVPTDYERNESNLQHAEFVTANCFVLRETLAALGGFDERFRLAWREDSELHFRLIDEAARRGGAVVKEERAIVVHPVRKAGWGVSLWQQKKSLYNALLYRLHPRHYRHRIQPRPPWHYYAIVLLSVAGLILGFRQGGLGWLPAAFAGGLIARFCYRRLCGTSHHPTHVAEMMVTSAAIPFLAVFYRCLGAVRFRVPFL